MSEELRHSMCLERTLDNQQPQSHNPQWIVRLQLEHLKVEKVLKEKGIESTVVIFGSARIRPAVPIQQKIGELTASIERLTSSADGADQETLHTLRAELLTQQRLLPLSKYYDQARELGRIVTRASDRHGMVVVTGGGPGIMEGANHGAHDAQGYSVGLNIVLPHEQHPNPYVTPELCFSFHYFSMRKMHFLQRARALVAFPGGWGTFDELFECLTLIQTKKMRRIPVLLFGREFWDKVVRWDGFVETGVIAPDDLQLFHFVETADDAWRVICNFYENAGTNTEK
ncbi:Bifunctional polymyxin resistance protein ArnA [Gonapodya sp. JEL0774]|nr:Bifunctional polymyxin resistance protein ArnA [Gonapodya sp. JEL0774]